ncbi:MAG: LysM peptidoglycan-binding domain-containing protein [Kiritimatiellia bacterium]
MTAYSSIPLLFTVLITLLVGCDRTTTVTVQDARDRENPLIRRALEREQIGDLDGAIQAYEEVLLDSPKLVSAHFHLALLLQDYRKDYMGAIYHYRQYEKLRPESEKKSLLHERTRVCQQLLIVQLLSSGNVAISRKQLELVSEIDKLNKRLSAVEGEKAALTEQASSLEHQLAEQKAESERLRRLLDRVMPASSGEDVRPRSVLPRLDPGTSQPAPTHSLTPPPAPRTSLIEPAAEPPTPSAGKPAAPEGAVPEPPALMKPTAPTATTENTADVAPPPQPVTAATRTYVVQPGDSVYRIAERVYGDPGDWKKIRDANKDRLGPGNQVRAGQVLVIP